MSTRAEVDYDRLTTLWAIVKACSKRPDGATVYDVVNALGHAHSRILGSRRERHLSWLRKEGLTQLRQTGREALWTPTVAGMARLEQAYRDGITF